MTPDKIKAFCEKSDIREDEVWQPRQGGAWAIKHKALERVAVKEKMEQQLLEIHQADLEHKAVIVKASYRKNGQAVSSFGECAPYNNKNSYPVAMAEKRAIDRCILKLAGVHGEIFSEEEADSFAQPSEGTGRVGESSTVAKDLYRTCEAALRKCTSAEMLDEFNKAYKDQLRAMPLKYQEQLAREWNEMAEHFSISEAR